MFIVTGAAKQLAHGFQREVIGLVQIDLHTVFPAINQGDSVAQPLLDA